MIKVASGELTLRDGAAGYGTLDLDHLQDDVWAACSDAGVHDPHLPRDMADIVGAYVLRRAELPDRAEVDALVARLLADCGLHEAARCWCARRRQDSLPVLGELLALDAATVRTRLAEDRFYPQPPEPAFVERVLAALRGLGLYSCSAQLLRDLGRHLWLRDRMAAEAAVPPRPGSEENAWLLRPADFPVILPPEQANWLDSGIVGLRPVSRLLPRLDMTVDLGRLLAVHRADLTLGELVLTPALDDLCRAVVGISERVYDAICQRLPAADLPAVDLRLTVRRVADYQAALAGAATPAGLQALQERLARDLCRLRHLDIRWQ